MTTTATPTSTATGRPSRDAAYLLFGQAMPSLSGDDQLEVVIALYDGDFDIAFTLLVGAIDDGGIQVDPDLLTYARAHTA